MKTTKPVKTMNNVKKPVKSETTAKAKVPVAAKTAVKAVAQKKPARKSAKAALKQANTVTFTYRADKGCEVFLAGTFNNWNGTAEKMKDESGTGVYTAVLALAPGAYEYKFVIDGTWCADPECADWVQNSHGTLNSVKHVTE